MQHETRRAKKAARQTQIKHKKRRQRRLTWTIVGVVVVTLLGCLAWLAGRAVSVKNDLEAAQSLVSSASAGGDLSSSLNSIGEHAASAASAANDPLWRAAEYVPIVGDNLRGVRLSAESLDTIVADLGRPIFALKAEQSTEPLLARALPILQEAAPKVAVLASQMDEVKASSFLIGPVRSGVDQVASVTSAAAPVLGAMPSLLGAEGPKNYLLVFQNNAESVGLGGSAASQTLVHVEGGSLSIVKQASSGSYRNGEAVDVQVDQSALDLYGSYLIDHANTATSRPDFPTAAKILRAFWQRDVDPAPVDGVVSIDPIALARILGATGPIQLATGDSLTKDNAVPMLLSDVYKRWDSYTQSNLVDAFFASVASEVFGKLSSGGFDPVALAKAVNTSIDTGDVMMWSDDPSIAGLIDGQRIAGVLPTSNGDATTVGVFYRDTSASKIDYYMKSSVDAQATCAKPGEGQFTVKSSLHLDIAQGQADELPRYVQSFAWGASQFRTEVYVYGPVGATFVSASVDGRDVRPISTEVDDLGRPVAAFETYLQPGESASVEAVFGGSGSFGPLQVRSTPMVQGTKVAVRDDCTG